MLVTACADGRSGDVGGTETEGSADVGDGDGGDPDGGDGDGDGDGNLDDGSECWGNEGQIIAETESPLPPSYGYERYCFPEPDDAVVCSGATNDSATIQAVYLAQTHALAPEHPLFFAIADRPALLEVVVSGTGASPEVRVLASHDGQPTGTLCLGGPTSLGETVDLNRHGRSDRFTVTMPRTWMKPGLSLEIRAGADRRTYGAADLGVEHAPHYNLLMVDMDVLNYNDGNADAEPDAGFLPDLAAAIPAAHVRFGEFPARVALPSIVVGGPGGQGGVQPIVMTERPCNGGETPLTDACGDYPDVSEGDINAAALRYVEALKRATGDYPFTHVYGNTNSLFPGGWGGDKSFVSADFDGVTLHEAGHALSLPHWGQGAYQNTTPGEWDYRYPYGGVGDDGGGRGNSWNYLQNEDLFTSPICQDPNSENLGEERSDGMQRNNYCIEWRDGVGGRWDGFSDFSALAMFRDMVGAPVPIEGLTPYNGGDAPFHLRRSEGSPTLTWGAGDGRELVRHDPDLAGSLERMPFGSPQAWDVPVYTVYGTYHPQATGATIIHEPIRYTGNLPAVVDPTDPSIFEDLAAFPNGPYEDYFWWSKDLTFKFIYAGGSSLHAIYPYGGVDRSWELGAGPWRRDLLYFALTVPADEDLVRVELYERPFLVRYPEIDEPGNITHQAFGITAENFMDDAVLVTAIDL